MASNVIAPDEGDDVRLKDGRTGYIGDLDEVIWQGGNDWQTTVTFDEGDNEDEVSVTVDPEKEGCWKEIGA